MSKDVHVHCILDWSDVNFFIQDIGVGRENQTKRVYGDVLLGISIVAIARRSW